QFVARLLTRASYTERVGRALYLRLAELTELAGWAAYDAGRHRTAPAYFHAALQAARAAGDRILGAYVLAMWGFAETDLGRAGDRAAQAAALAARLRSSRVAEHVESVERRLAPVA